MSRDNGDPMPDVWKQPEPRPCPFPCSICTTPQESIWMHGVDNAIAAAELDGRGTE